MANIAIQSGLDVPISGKPSGNVQPLPKSTQIALDLTPFTDLSFRLLLKVGDSVKIGQPLAEDKACPSRLFVSPAGGVIKEIERGEKRQLQRVIIDVAANEEWLQHAPVDVNAASREEIIAACLKGGLFAHIRQRPFNLPANPQVTPKAIFVKAIESAPFVPPPELQVAGNEDAFQAGLTALTRLTSGKVHLIYRKGSSFAPFANAKDVTLHTAEGPHPVSNVSLHIHCLEPIQSPEEAVWTLNACDVIALGHLLQKGRYYIDRVISIAGPAVQDEKRGYFQGRMGYSIDQLAHERLSDAAARLISGDPLMGQQVDSKGFLGFYHQAFCAISENKTREFLSFFRLGGHKFTATKTYLSGFLSNKEYDFDTNAHGEHRAFVEGNLYQQVMPMRIPAMQLVKSVLAEDYEMAQELGLLEVDAEDFALPTFICPSKIEHSDIIAKGLKAYAKEVLA